MPAVDMKLVVGSACADDASCQERRSSISDAGFWPAEPSEVFACRRTPADHLVPVESVNSNIHAMNW